MKKIGLIAAMSGELNALLESMGEVTPLPAPNGKRVLYAKQGDKEIYLAESGIGEIYSTMAAQHLITAYGVEAIINFGVCGSLKKKHTLKKTVILSSVVHYEMDTSDLDGVEVGRYAHLPSVYIPLDKSLIEKAQAFDPTIETAICASGNKFVTKESDKRYLTEQFDADVCEMESAGIALTCMANNVPCLLIKAISDGEGGAEEFRAVVDEASRVYISLVKMLMQSL